MNDGSPSQIQAQLPRPPINTRISLIVVPEFEPSDPKSAIPRPPEGSAGWYRITFVLGIPGKEFFRTNVDIRQFLASGESLLLVASNIVQLQVDVFNDQESVQMHFHANDEKTLARAELRLFGNSERQVIRNATNLVLPLLSWWSFAFDVAVDMVGYEVYEERTDTRTVHLSFLGRQKSVHELPGAVPPRSKPEFRRVLAAYREALNTANPFYRLICLERVIEGAEKIRADRHAATLSAGRVPEDPQERIPPEEDPFFQGSPFEIDREAFRPYYGQKFTRVRQQLSRTLRNAAAHLDPHGDSLCADDFDDVAGVEQAMPVVRYIARTMLEHEIALDPDLSPIGSPPDS